MGKMSAYILIFSGMMLTFYFMGVLPDTNPVGGILDMLLSPESFQANSLLDLLTSTLGLVGLATGAILVGLAFINPELAVVGAFVTFMGSLLWGFIDVYVQIASYNVVLATLIFSPIFFLFAVTLIEWWRGRD